MALVIADRVQETSTTAGTGTLTLDGAVFGFQSFAAIGNANTTYYSISDPVTGDWEVGLGTYTSAGTTLSRTTVLSSSNAGALVPFAANIKNVFATYPSAKAVYEDDSNNTSLPANLTFTGTGNRITGDFSNATIANRVAFQTSTVNGNTAILTLPNGTATTAQFQAANNSDPTNAAIAQFAVTSSDVRVISGIFGTGTYVPMLFYIGGSERMRVDTSGNVLVTSPARLGYGAGSGGTVSQGTSRTTAVTLNKPTGQITMFSAAGSASWQNFTVNNSVVAATDTVSITYTGGSNSYLILPFKVSAGSFGIWFYSLVGVAVDAPLINFAVIKASTS